MTHNHQRETLAPLLADADRWAQTLTPAVVLAQIGSPFAPDPPQSAAPPAAGPSLMLHDLVGCI